MGNNIIIIILIVLILYIISINYAPGFNIRRYDTLKLEGLSKYECGEESMEELKKDELYIKYYMIALTYLLFDIEIILLFPYISYLISFNNIINYTLTFYSTSVILFFFFFVLLGLIFEYFYGLFN